MIQTVEILTINELNKNNRIYPRELVEKMVETQKEVYFGMIGMPEGIDASVDFTNVSHACDNLRIEGDKLLADVKIMDTPKGKLLTECLKLNPNGAFRTAGYGTFEEGSLSGRVGEYTLTAINWVEKPS